MPRHNSTALRPTVTTSIAHKALAAVEPVSPKTPQELEKMLMQRLKSYMQGFIRKNPKGQVQLTVIIDATVVLVTNNVANLCY